ncbi:MAG: HNH endonuclease [Gemmatimonadaceae bacterium]|nr:HNH endonuclease [Gemmatimonadaceae bacterium]
MAPKKAEAEPRGRGARATLRAYFLAHVGDVLEGRDLREVAGGITEWARRVRELRSLDGFQIETDKDDSTLRPGQYRLASAKPRPRIAAAISKQTRAYVLDRNGFTCQMCGAVAGEPHPNDSSRRTRLHIGHIQDLSHGGSDEPSNLRALCSLCNEGAQNITAPRPKLTQLLTQVRRATVADQQEVLAWLMRKFPALRR